MNIQIHCMNPLVVVIDDSFEKTVADEIITMGKDKLQRATVVDVSGKKSTTIHDARTNSSSTIDQWSNPVLTGLVETISNLVRLPPENTEPGQLLHYVGDQKFDPHTDAFDQSAGGLDNLAKGGQRLFTSICYLNDVEEGGETTFPELKLAVKPKCGRTLIFANTRLGTNMEHPHSKHAGTHVKQGEKWAYTLWWRQLAYHVQREYPANEGDIKEV